MENNQRKVPNDPAHDMIKAGRMLTANEVLQMWPMARETLTRLTRTTDEARRIPSVYIGTKPYYPFDELMWYREKHRFVPTQKRRQKQ